MEKFGTPKAGDPTAIHEQDVMDALNELSTIVKEEVPRIINRPLGSQRLPDEELVQDWASVLVDRDAAGARLAELMQQEGEARGREQFVEAVLKVQELMGHA